MDLPDGGNVTPLEQVARMVEDYRQRIVALQGLRAQLCANADRDIAALRQRIAELEARTLTVKLPDYRDTYKEAFASEVEHHVRSELGKLAAAAGIKLPIEGE